MGVHIAEDDPEALDSNDEEETQENMSLGTDIETEGELCKQKIKISESLACTVPVHIVPLYFTLT